MAKGKNAFPVGEGHNGYDGLSKREYFAAQALVGIIATYSQGSYRVDIVAADAVYVADALLAELAKKNEQAIQNKGPFIRA